MKHRNAVYGRSAELLKR